MKKILHYIGECVKGNRKKDLTFIISLGYITERKRSRLVLASPLRILRLWNQTSSEPSQIEFSGCKLVGTPAEIKQAVNQQLDRLLADAECFRLPQKIA